MNKELLKKISILYVEDEADIRSMTQQILTTLCRECVVAEDGLDGLQKFKKQLLDETLDDFDIIVTDINMPNMNGLDMLAHVKEIEHNLPFVITTAYTDSAFLRQSIELGVRGYAVKPVDLSELLKSISMAVESRVLEKELEVRVAQRTEELNSALKNLEKKSKLLEYEATHDHLTTLYNRQKFNQELERECARRKRYDSNLSIIMLDLDHFKSVNDDCGHIFGDEILVKVSTLFKGYTRESDIVCRWGGEEFIILLPETNLKDALAVAQKIRLGIENDNLCCKTKQITISLGVTTVLNNDTVDTLLNRVDRLLYKAKDSGRNCVISE